MYNIIIQYFEDLYKSFLIYFTVLRSGTSGC